VLAFALAAASAVLFGAMAVAIRASFRPGSDPEAVSLATTSGALVVCLVLAAPFLGGLTWHGVWPFLVAGLVAPGLSQVLFVRAIDAIGASRTAILVGVSPLLSALFAISLLGEPIRAGLVLGTFAIVGGALALVATRSAAARLTAAGAAAGVLAASLISVRDNFVRWADTGNAVPGVVAATACLVSATTLIAAILLARQRPLFPASLRPTLRPLAAAALLFGLAYGAVFVAFDHGRVTIVAPLYATESLWAVVWSALLLKRAEGVGPRLVLAAVLMVAGGVLIGVSR
jgi:drug/metabolite transporter (DMT)-like permease